MRQIQGLLLILICTTATAAVKGGEPTIKMLGVGSPVVGSQSTFGRVVLTAPAAQRVVITLLSSNTRIATAPADVIINVGGTDQTFVVKTDPVAAPTTLTLTARTTGSPDATATFTVIPPSLASLDCEPKSIPGGEHATCKAWMDGIVAVGAAPKLDIWSGQNATSAQPSVTVPPGSRSVTFDVIVRGLPQTATATVLVSYAGVTKKSSLTVTPAAISSFGCVVTNSYPEPYNTHVSSQCSVIGGDDSSSSPHYVGLAVYITAPAPQLSYKIPLTFTLSPPPPNPFDTGIPQTLHVPAGKKYAFYPLQTSPVASTEVIKVRATDPITHNSYETELTVSPPGIKDVHFEQATINAVPLGGKDVNVIVEFMSDPPKDGIAYDATYAGTTDIKGPARVRINPPDHSRRDAFKVKVFPCAINPPCHVSATLAGHTGTATVNP